MRNRITERMLKSICDDLNKATGNPVERGVGNYHINYAYGGTQLQQFTGTGGQCIGITSNYEPKRKVYEYIQAMLRGIRL